MLKNLSTDAGDRKDVSSIPGSGRSPREGNGTPTFLPAEFHGQRSLEGYSPWGHKELDMTEQLMLVPSRCLIEDSLNK